MDGGKVRALVVVVLVMGMLVGQSSAGFKGCYAKCFMFCMIKPPHSALHCGGKCLKHCIIPSSTAQPTGHDFCKLGCASTSCTNISTQAEPGEEKVESCVGSCSELCSKNYLAP
ncbi:Thionin-like protein [Actinidia chinensis var. chinensis]|uniref:Thionin-like protein n=1 Tax=Actinidia chinensis var. chinensis TaxID=1590841 RepID=A0A2R6Q3V1_ACTCC|nr:Thionin-like protein [Actinidia chinensis var. chinensis]